MVHHPRNDPRRTAPGRAVRDSTSAEGCRGDQKLGLRQSGWAAGDFTVRAWQGRASETFSLKNLPPYHQFYLEESGNQREILSVKTVWRIMKDSICKSLASYERFYLLESDTVCDIPPVRV